ncbi:FeoB-associated Cys-rich membrane protein [Oceanidesulfovibrio marinus]|uniref:FeoB-associated Cys-rich membrane protein n=2 Tax=Oceanidesulfovibrio marinus TaxID=370038 RepID=A0ABX6NHJ9_9BACT|nr:FeoB-associated Cys-rich membrane protein [Oceanidesulfovibrio marinus]
MNTKNHPECSMSLDTAIVAIIVLLAAIYAGRKLYRQAMHRETCGSCGGCCPTPDEREPNRQAAGQSACCGCASHSTGAPIGDRPER